MTAISKHYAKGCHKDMNNMKRDRDLQKRDPDMKQLSNPGRQEIIACQMLVRENYRCPLMEETRRGEIDGGGGPYGLQKNRKYTSGGEGGVSYITRGLEIRISTIFH